MARALHAALRVDGVTADRRSRDEVVALLRLWRAVWEEYPIVEIQETLRQDAAYLTTDVRR